MSTKTAILVVKYDPSTFELRDILDEFNGTAGEELEITVLTQDLEQDLERATRKG